MDTHSIILGIDPGTRITGYGLIQQRGHQLIPIDFGCIRPPTKSPIEKKYLAIFEGIEALIEKYRPKALAIETQFVYKNVQSALKLGMARAAALIPAAKANIPIFEYAPKRAKKAVVGTGSASKEQVQKMLQMLLALSEPPTPEDAADALALAICCAHGKEI